MKKKKSAPAKTSPRPVKKLVEVALEHVLGGTMKKQNEMGM